jgi:hypothetical protein
LTNTSTDRQHQVDPVFDIRSSADIKVFYADRTLSEGTALVGSGGMDLAPNGPAVGPFPASYSVYRNALAIQNESNLKVNADILRTHRDDLEVRYQ